MDRSRRHLPALARTALTLILAASCFHSPPDPGVHADEGRVALTVRNNHHLDVTIYVIHDGQATRVGAVTAANTNSLDVPNRMLGQGRMIRLRADPLGSSRSHTSESVRVGVGQRIEWTLESDLDRSHIAVY
jgi:hypothetical protein